MLPKNKTFKKKKTDLMFLLKEAELEKKKEKRNKILYFLLFFSALGCSSLIIVF
jgi:hypothetical protein